MGKKKMNDVLVDEVINEQPQEASVTVTEKKSPGRPADPVKAALKHEKEAMRAAGLIKKGRPAVDGSKRQQRLAEREAKLAAGILKKGRPKYTEEQKAAAAAARAAAKQAMKETEKEEITEEEVILENED